MGNDQPKISYETVDKTDPKAREKGQQQAREENERRMRELEEAIIQERERAFQEARERALADHTELQRRLDREKKQREEEEKKRKEEAELLQLKNSLLNYDFHMDPRIRKEAFQGLDVEDIDVVRIALIGPTGSGKTSLIGTLQRALSTQQTAFEMGAGREGTILLEEYPVQKNISIVDTRGFFEGDEQLMEECLNIMSGRIRPAEEIRRLYDDDEQGNRPTERVVTSVENAQAFSKYAHAVIFVMKANDPRLTDGKYIDTLKKIREHFRKDGYVPVTVITYLDKLKNEVEKENAFDNASWATGSPLDRTYFIKNYTKDLPESSMVTERTALDVLEHVLMSAETFIRIRKQREKRRRDAGTGVSTTGVETVEQLFARLEKENYWTNKERVKSIVSAIHQREVRTVPVLKELWEDIKQDLQLTMGMEVVLDEEMKKI